MCMFTVCELQKMHACLFISLNDDTDPSLINNWETLLFSSTHPSIHPSAPVPILRLHRCLLCSALGSVGIMEDRGVHHSSHSITCHRHDSPLHTHIHTRTLSPSLSLFPLIVVMGLCK